MTAKTAPDQAGPGPERQARRPSSADRMIRYGIWLAVAARGLGDQRFQTNVITRILGAYALVSVLKNNEKRPVRRTLDWYKRVGDPTTSSSFTTRGRR
jgi:hypothetical protein